MTQRENAENLGSVVLEAARAGMGALGLDQGLVGLQRATDALAQPAFGQAQEVGSFGMAVLVAWIAITLGA